MEDLYVKFTVSINKLNKIILKIKSLEMSKYGLQPIHASCIYYLFKNTQGLTSKELCELTLEDKAAISRAVKKLQENKVVEYSLHGRNIKIVLTKIGEKIAQEISEKIKCAVKAGSVNLTDGERDFFYNSLIEISDNLIKYYKNISNCED